MARFRFEVGVQAQDDDAVSAKIQIKLPSGEVHQAEKELDETGKAMVSSPAFVANKGDFIGIVATLYDAEGNASAPVEDIGVIRDTIGPHAPLVSIVTTEQIPDAPTE